MIKFTGRIFTFGCSFTEYDWPTWSDIILYDNKGYNFGVTGSGFDSVLYRLLEVDRKYKFTSEDVIIIVLTTPLRWDFIVDDKWSYYGQVTTSRFAKYEGELFCIDGLLFKSFYNIQLINDFLEKRNLKFIYGSVNNLYKNIGNYFEYLDISEDTKELIKCISDKFEIKLQDFNSYLNGDAKTWKLTKTWKDGSLDYHPRPIDYYNWVNDVLIKYVDIKVKVTKDEILVIEENIDNSEYYLDLLKMNDKFPKFFEHKHDNSIYIDKK